MLLSRALRISHPDNARGNVIAFAGSGGKTTSIFQIARELPPPVIVTTTTHLGIWQIPFANQHVIANKISDISNFKFDGITLISGSIQDDRIGGIDEIVLFWLRAYSKEHDIPILIEADGARQKALKAPGDNEPVIPDFVDTVIVAAGLNSLGKPLNDENVHRSQIFSTLCGLAPNKPVTPEALTRVLTHPNGGLKNIPPSAKSIVFLNQADTPELQSVGGAMSSSLLDHFDAVIVGSFQQSHFQTFEKTGGIILAAGASTRFGKPKQLLDWHGEPFIRSVAQTALKAKLSPVIVVTGANAEEIEPTIRDLPITIIQNNDWQSGQSSSIRAGVQQLPDRTGSTIFLLADQPQINIDVIQALIEHHTAELYPIVAPLVMMERRANPVLFDRLTFPDLLRLEGDVGGRAIFSRHPVEYLPWHDDRLLLDVDKPEDYQRLVEDDTL